MYVVREELSEMMFALVQAHNAQHKATVSTKFHYDQLGPGGGDYRTPSAAALSVTAANASSLSTSITLANQLKAVYNAHIADTLDVWGAGVHKAADSTNPVTTANAATLLSEVNTLLNAIKTKFNAHLTQSGVHENNDSTNTESTTNATDQSSANTLANSLKTKLNAHIASVPAGSMIRLTST